MHQCSRFLFRSHFRNWGRKGQGVEEGDIIIISAMGLARVVCYLVALFVLVQIGLWDSANTPYK